MYYFSTFSIHKTFSLLKLKPMGMEIGFNPSSLLSMYQNGSLLLVLENQMPLPSVNGFCLKDRRSKQCWYFIAVKLLLDEGIYRKIAHKIKKWNILCIFLGNEILQRIFTFMFYPSYVEKKHFKLWCSNYC